jgi:predicted DNA-binding transcriptional regulator AlpA
MKPTALGEGLPRYVTLRELCGLLHVSRGRITQLRADPRAHFPAPRKLSSGRAARLLWRLEDVVQWIELRTLRVDRTPPQPINRRKGKDASK